MLYYAQRGKVEAQSNKGGASAPTLHPHPARPYANRLEQGAFITYV
jgi:hypothetical protein